MLLQAHSGYTKKQRPNYQIHTSHCSRKRTKPTKNNQQWCLSRYPRPLSRYPHLPREREGRGIEADVENIDEGADGVRCRIARQDSTEHYRQCHHEPGRREKPARATRRTGEATDPKVKSTLHRGNTTPRPTQRTHPAIRGLAGQQKAHAWRDWRAALVGGRKNYAVKCPD